ncbi:dipeptidase [Marinomonas colpomeniae]|uniref:Membrane dipeptidase n=1 Tax=Marinomonas colpomeniae TaxID=2774408 RepID=A0ABR8NVS0_9GAMM|nr:membrane dipeptidase [Marinomonas colpomeniae]MBD5770008.1 membrane dipeptidase [Marinomonas colpomeniae]
MTAIPVWDAHTCVPLFPEYDLASLQRHIDSGAYYISINVGMDFNPLDDIIQIIAGFRKRISELDFLIQVDSFADVIRAQKEGKLAVSFDLEGGVPLCESPAMVDLFAQLGVRQIHLAYNRTNSLAGGCHDEDPGLSVKGRAIVDAINSNKLFMDVSHTGYRTSMDIFEYSTQPVIISHGNPRALKDHARNYRDDQLQACAATGGVVCINGVSRFLNSAQASPESMVEAIDYLVQLLGPEHVGLGLDYVYDCHLDKGPDGLDLAHWWPPEYGYDKANEGFLNILFAPPERFLEMTALLQSRGYKQADIEAIYGTNMRTLAQRIWC